MTETAAITPMPEDVLRGLRVRKSLLDKTIEAATHGVAAAADANGIDEVMHAAATLARATYQRALTIMLINNIPGALHTMNRWLTAGATYSDVGSRADQTLRREVAMECLHDYSPWLDDAEVRAIFLGDRNHSVGRD